MMAMIENEQCFVVTADHTGQPSAAPKGSMIVVDEKTLAYGEALGKQTYENIRENPKVAVVVADRDAQKGYRFTGTAELRSGGPVFTRFSERFGRMDLILKAVVVITINEIYDLSVKNAGAKIG
jgi:predicted pyridoxine 5'-phosphate oxidase superfamily flavin-nucleotide-binding protein